MNDIERLPVITLYQPWASWVMLGWKTIETRRHCKFKSLAGRLIGIHAAMKIDQEAEALARPYLKLDRLERTHEFIHQRGCILGTVRVVEVRKLGTRDSWSALCDCGYSGRWGLVLENPVMFRPAIKVSGHQGIWYINKRELCQTKETIL